MGTFIWNDEHFFLRLVWRNIASDFNWMRAWDYATRAYHPPLHFFLHLFTGRLIHLFTTLTGEHYRLISLVLSSAAFARIAVLLQGKDRLHYFVFPVAFWTQHFLEYYWQIGPYSLILFLASGYMIELKPLFGPDESSRPQPMWIGFYALTLSYTHYFGTMLVFISGLILFWYHRKDLTTLATLFKIYFSTFLLFLPWIFVTKKNLLGVENYHASGDNQTFSEYLTQFIHAFTGEHEWTYFIFILFLYVLWTERKNKRPSFGTFSLSCVILTLVFVIIKSLFQTSVLRPHLLLALLPAFILGLILCTRSAFASVPVRILTLVLLTLPALMKPPPVYQYRFANWQGAFLAVKKELAAHPFSRARPVFLYYGSSGDEFLPYQMIHGNIPVQKTFIRNACPANVDMNPKTADIIAFISLCLPKNWEAPSGWKVVYDSNLTKVYRWEP